MSTPGPLRAARQKTSAGPVGWLGPLLAVLLGGVGVVLLRDAVVAKDGTGRAGSWTGSATSAVNGLTPSAWMIPVGIVVALLGLWLVVAALRPRKRRTLALRSASGAHLQPVDVARRASAAAHDVDGVLSASTKASRRTAKVKIHTTASGAAGREITGQVRASVEQSLASLVKPPRITIKATSSGDDS